MPVFEQAIRLLTRKYGGGTEPQTTSIPGRINLIGEHIDYHHLPVLPMAIQRCVHIAFRARKDRRVRAFSALGPTDCEFELTPALQAGPAGDWANYLKAAAVAVGTRWGLAHGVDAAIVSNLPPAAGLSSSTAVLAGFAIALLRANEHHPTTEDLMKVLPEGEHFVGTRGGGMDHAAVLAARRRCALLVGFNPFELRHVPIPPDWSFLVAHSLTTAEKSGALRSKYNALREDGMRALHSLGFSSFQAALANGPVHFAGKQITAGERLAFLHVVNEAARVREAVAALENGEMADFGRLLLASHASLRDNLSVSTPVIDTLVKAAVEAGALGARLTGAGFGGCVIALCPTETRDRVYERLTHSFYSNRTDFHPEEHLFLAEPSDGALAG